MQNRLISLKAKLGVCSYVPSLLHFTSLHISTTRENGNENEKEGTDEIEWERNWIHLERCLSEIYQTSDMA